MNHTQAIHEQVQAYFSGLHHGDVTQLQPLFHADCVLKAPGLRRTLEAWLADVQCRPVPAHTGHPWAYRILNIDVEGNQAMVKVNCPLPHGNFIDYLGLLRENAEWKIVNKMYAPAGNKPA